MENGNLLLIPQIFAQLAVKPLDLLYKLTLTLPEVPQVSSDISTCMAETGKQVWILINHAVVIGTAICVVVIHASIALVTNRSSFHQRLLLLGQQTHVLHEL